MNLYQSIFLGMIQGLTEFLPVSSSGHLVIAQALIPNFTQPGVLFDVVLHAGTLFSVIIFFRKKLLGLDRQYIKLLLVGTIPAVILGFLFKDFFESLFSVVKLVGVTLILTAALNYFTDKFDTPKSDISPADSLFIGIFQAFAIVPGISRSGSTIFAGTKKGIARKSAAEFSFLLSLPAVFGANLLEIVSLDSFSDVKATPYILGFIAAFFSGLFAIKLVFQSLSEKKFKIFSAYCLILGLITLLLLN
jgi:undecaprenyl-diphosphatase